MHQHCHGFVDRRVCFVATIALASVLATTSRAQTNSADLILLGGDIITVDASTPTAEAVAVHADKIVAVGKRDEVLQWKGEKTKVVDLQGKTLLPGFIDAHGHVTQLAQLQAAANVAPPPVGPVKNFADIKKVLLEYKAAHHLQKGDWILGAGYDPSLLAERRHPTKFDLDKISTENPLLLIHVSLHLATANNLALQLTGITAGTKDPQGGVFHRVEGSTEPNGVMEEQAWLEVMNKLPVPQLEERLALLPKALGVYASYGITTVQDGFTQPDDLKLLRTAAEQNLLTLDVVAYVSWLAADRMLNGSLPVGEYHSRFKVGGVKMVFDGSLPGKTAWLSQPYYEPPPGQGPEYRGYPAMSDEDAAKFVAHFYQQNWQVLAHTNGDAACEQFINAIASALVDQPQRDRRTVMIHAQTVREDQLDRLKELRIIPSFLSAHPFYWGDYHRESVLGPERAYRISPAKSVLDRGMLFTMHNDAPIVPPDILRLIWISVNRRSRSNDIIGPAQRIPVMEAIKAVTINAAYQYFEEDHKGSITSGKQADLVILSGNPLKVDPMTIQDLKVLETISRGVTVFRADGRE